MATLHLICGMAGAGKSSLAKHLESTHRALRLSPDEWIKALSRNLADCEEADRLRDPVEQLQWRTAQELLGQGVCVILENGFWGRDERLAYNDTAKAIGAEVVLHYLDVPKDELWRRIEKRNATLPDGFGAVSRHDLETWLSWFQAPDDEEAKHYDNFIRHPSTAPSISV